MSLLLLCQLEDDLHAERHKATSHAHKLGDEAKRSAAQCVELQRELEAQGKELTRLKARGGPQRGMPWGECLRVLLQQPGSGSQPAIRETWHVGHPRLCRRCSRTRGRPMPTWMMAR